MHVNKEESDIFFSLIVAILKLQIKCHFLKASKTEKIQKFPNKLNTLILCYFEV